MTYKSFLEELNTEKGIEKYLFNFDGSLRHVLFSQQFSKRKIINLCENSEQIRNIFGLENGTPKLSKRLTNKRIMNLFAQPSTRTAQSFMAAAENLGASTKLVSDLNTSSFAKGETVEDTVRTLSSFFDAIVVRHPQDDFASKSVWALENSSRPVSVISAGCGSSQHVTQSLLDVYTMYRSFERLGGIDNKKIVIVSDLSRNRAALSLSYMLSKFLDITIIFVCPPEFQMDPPFYKTLTDSGTKFVTTHSLESLEKITNKFGKPDAIYMTRVQAEYGNTNNEIKASDDFVLKKKYEKHLSDHSIIMHPLPRINELPKEWENHPGFMAWKQIRNGMWIRTALFFDIFGLHFFSITKGKKLSVRIR